MKCWDFFKDPAWEIEVQVDSCVSGLEATVQVGRRTVGSRRNVSKKKKAELIGCQVTLTYSEALH